MGQHDIRTQTPPEDQRRFVRSLLDDLVALERMLESGRIESGTPRLGAEQELFLVGRNCEPIAAALPVLETANEPRLTTELGAFNLEANLTPLELRGDCLSRMQAELDEVLARARGAAESHDARVALCGILPTLRHSHFELDYMVPAERYSQLNHRMVEARGRRFQTYIKGLDELQISSENVMLEACNTSFQVHLQVDPADFARSYNVAQAAAAPVLAAAANSPMMLGRRLWHETRVALLQQSLDTRSEVGTLRDSRRRVTFGNDWARESVLELLRDDVARFRPLVTIEPERLATELLEAGEVPRLASLCLHNGTIYRWNRPCYGVFEGRPHLRIENRMLPAGPTPADEIANAAFFVGLVHGLLAEVEDVAAAMPFDAAKANFTSAARYGLQARFRWLGEPARGADHLILRRLIPCARRGLDQLGVDARDSEHYLGILEDRVASGRTGAQWLLDSVESLGPVRRVEERARIATRRMVENQEEGRPVHEWPTCDAEDPDLEDCTTPTVAEVMTHDLFTLHPEDPLELAAGIMDWKNIRHIPVEGSDGTLEGLLGHRALLRVLFREQGSDRSLAVREAMHTTPITVPPETPCTEAIRLMREHSVGCLPVVRRGQLIGLVSERDFIRVSSRLLDTWLRQS